MRQLSAVAEQQRLSTSQDVYWVIELCTEGESVYLSQRPLICEGCEFEPIIQELSIRLRPFPDILIPAPGRHRSSIALVKLVRSSSVAETLIQSVRQGTLQGTLCRIGLFLKDPSQSPSFSDIIWCGWFAVSDASEDRTSFTFSLIDVISARSNRVAGRVITADICEYFSEKVQNSIIQKKQSGMINLKII